METIPRSKPQSNSSRPPQATCAEDRCYTQPSIHPPTTDIEKKWGFTHCTAKMSRNASLDDSYLTLLTRSHTHLSNFVPSTKNAKAGTLFFLPSVTANPLPQVPKPKRRPRQ